MSRMYSNLQGQSYEERLRNGTIHHNFKDLTGQVFGKLRIVKPLYSTGKKWVWLAQCECGTFVTRQSAALSKSVKNSQSGGLCRRCVCELISKHRRTHGMSNTPIYNVWHSMRLRCDLPTYPAYPRYGGRGIKYCERWETFQNFYDDMSPTYQPGLVLDRIDNNGNYSPENCRWTTYKENCRNRETIYADIDLSSLAEASGISRSTLQYRVQHGWPLELLTLPPDLSNAKLRAYMSQTKYRRKYST